MKVLITGHKGFIGRHVFADWRRELGYAHVRGIDHPDCVSSFKGGDFDSREIYGDSIFFDEDKGYSSISNNIKM